jgi:hypothetical protein
VTPSISISPSFSNTPSVTFTPSISISKSISNTPSISISKSISNTPSISISKSISNTPSITVSRSRTPSFTPSISISKSISNTPTVTPTRTPSTSPPAVSVTRTPSVTPSTSRPSFTLNIYAKQDAAFVLGTSAVWTSLDNVNFTRQGSLMGTTCVVKATLSVVTGTTVYYTIADGSAGPPSNYNYRAVSGTTACPTTPSATCTSAVVVTANTNIAITAQEVLC